MYNAQGVVPSVTIKKIIFICLIDVIDDFVQPFVDTVDEFV
jgi:hypothetical protein